jgi:UDP-N-acetyl-D-glucosamine dehydrogenase
MIEILKKINNKKIKICVIGLGYVGLPLVRRFVEKNIITFGIDSDKIKISKLLIGKNYIKNFNFHYFKKNNKQLSSTFDIVKNVDIIFICLPTPLKNNKPDLSYIKKCITSLMPHLKKDQTIILESTVYPGATNELVKKEIDKRFNIGKNFFLGYSPERENPGDKNFSYQSTPKVISGSTKMCIKIVSLIYSKICAKVYIAKNIEIAEASKLLENLYRAVNIGLINEFKMICKKLKIDVYDVIDAAATKNFGFNKFMPGPGWGGHCIPIDPFYLSWRSKQVGYNPKLIEATGKINNDLPKILTDEIINFFKKKKIKILIIGISYKKNVDDDRESPAYEFIKYFLKNKIYFDYFDPHFHSLKIGRTNKLKKKRVNLTKKNLRFYDGVLIVTDHDNIDYKKIYTYSNTIFDTRGIMKKIIKKDHKNKIIYI